MEISSTTPHHQKVKWSPREEVAKAREEESPVPVARVERKRRPNLDNKAIRCARCSSTNTKFCYYNNYSMAQPRFFCKQCRRYWTHGGSLRNVPIGGGCRKNSCSSSSKTDKLMPEPMAKVAPSFPNVLPTFSSTGFELSSAFPFTSSSSKSNPATTLAPGGTFLDILTGGLLQGGLAGDNGMVMPPPPTFSVGAGLNLMMQQHGLGGTADHATATQGSILDGMEGGGLEWPSQLGGGGGSAGRGQVGAEDEQKQGNNVMMDSNGCYCYWPE